MNSSDLEQALAAMRTYDCAAPVARGGDLVGYFQKVRDGFGDPNLHPIDESIAAVCDAYEKTRGASQIVQLNTNQIYTLHFFARRMAVVAMRSAVTESLHIGLIALAIEGAKYDFRETLGSLAVLQHAARRIGVDFPTLVAKDSPLIGDGLAQLVANFLHSGPAATSLEKFGFEEEMDKTGVTIALKL